LRIVERCRLAISHDADIYIQWCVVVVLILAVCEVVVRFCVIGATILGTLERVFVGKRTSQRVKFDMRKMMHIIAFSYSLSS